MRTLKFLCAAALVMAVGVGTPGAAEAQTPKAGTLKTGAIKQAKGKRHYSARPAPRVHYSRPPRVVG